MLVFFVFWIAVVSLLSVYVGVHLLAAFGEFFPNRVVFWAVFLSIAQSYMITMAVYRWFDVMPPSVLHWVISSLLGFFALLTLAIILFDLIFLYAFIKKDKLPLYAFILSRRMHIGSAVVGFVVLLFIYGLINASIVRETVYVVDLQKSLPQNVRIVMVSDVHINSWTTAKKLKNLVGKINSHTPDLVLFAGDVFDSQLKPFFDLDAPDIFRRINSKHGVYGVLGNHEFYGDGWKEAAEAFYEARISPLVDSFVYIPELNITLIGRNDFGYHRQFGVEPRMPLAELVGGVSAESALIVLDHQPHNVVNRETQAAGVDLQLAGHTHKGQFFPFNLLTSIIYENHYGLLQKGAYNLLVSSGFSTWGPPIRIGTTSEIVVIHLHGAEK